MNRGLVAIVLTLVWLMPRAGLARELVLHLATQDAPAPSHLCVAASYSRALTAVEHWARTKPGAPGGHPDFGHSAREGFGLVPADWMFDPKTQVDDAAGWSGPALTALLYKRRAKPAGPTSAGCGAWERGNPGDAAPATTCDAPRRYEGTCALVVAENQLADSDKVSCQANVQPSLAKGRFAVAVIKLEQARVVSFRMAGDVARIQIEQPPEVRGQTPLVSAVGGHYFSDVKVPVTESRGAELVELALKPRCSEERLHVPKFDCSSAPEDHGLVLAEAGAGDERAYAWLPRDALAAGVIEVPNSTGPTTTLKLSACKGAHLFETRWNNRTSPEPRTLTPTRVEFEWEIHPLATPEQCPREVELADQGVSCEWSREAAPRCVYSCPGRGQTANVTLPAQVAFAAPAPIRPVDPSCPSVKSSTPESVEDRWQVRLSQAGQKVSGFLPEAQRELHLEWPGWCGAAGDVSTLWGERVNFVVLGTQDGRSLRVRPLATRVRAPRVEPKDTLTVSFIGDREHNLATVVVKPGGVVAILPPADDRLGEHIGGSYADRVVFSGVLGGGLRRVNGAGGSTKWNPYGEADILLTPRVLRFPPFRDRRATRSSGADLYVDPEFRIGILFTTAAYSSRFQSSTFSDQARWENIPILKFPLELLLHFFGQQPFHFGLGGGAMLSREMYADDERRVSQAVSPTLAGNVGVSLVRLIAIDLDARHAFAGEIIRREFDESGLRSSSVSSGGTWFIGARLRVDNWFAGSRNEATLSQAPTPTATPARAVDGRELAGR